MDSINDLEDYIRQQANDQLSSRTGGGLKSNQVMAGQLTPSTTYGESHRPTLRDRLKRQMEHSQQEQSRSKRASELHGLLCKHEDVARILELKEELGE